MAGWGLDPPWGERFRRRRAGRAPARPSRPAPTLSWLASAAMSDPPKGSSRKACRSWCRAARASRLDKAFATDSSELIGPPPIAATSLSLAASSRPFATTWSLVAALDAQVEVNDSPDERMARPNAATSLSHRFWRVSFAVFAPSRRACGVSDGRRALAHEREGVEDAVNARLDAVDGGLNAATSLQFAATRMPCAATCRLFARQAVSVAGKRGAGERRRVFVAAMGPSLAVNSVDVVANGVSCASKRVSDAANDMSDAAFDVLIAASDAPTTAMSLPRAAMSRERRRPAGLPTQKRDCARLHGYLIENPATNV